MRVRFYYYYYYYYHVLIVLVCSVTTSERCQVSWGWESEREHPPLKWKRNIKRRWWRLCVWKWMAGRTPPPPSHSRRREKKKRTGSRQDLRKRDSTEKKSLHRLGSPIFLEKAVRHCVLQTWIEEKVDCHGVTVLPGRVNRSAFPSLRSGGFKSKLGLLSFSGKLATWFFFDKCHTPVIR